MTTNPAPLKERLLAMYSHRGDGIPTQFVNPDGPEAVARIEELEGQVKGIADFLIDQRDEPWPGPDTGRIHYWRDKAIYAAHRLRALAATEQGKKP